MNTENNKKNIREIVEDVPRYRSVMIAGPMSAPPMPRSFASSAQPFKVAPQAVVQPKGAKNASSTAWKVDNIPSLPAAYFLERSSTRVEGHPQEIANRICETLRQESVPAFCSKDDKVRLSIATHRRPSYSRMFSYSIMHSLFNLQNLLLAETNDCLKFAVRLFADQGQIVVELQRKCGCSYQFRETARGLLRAAKGLASAPKRKFDLPSSVPQDTNEQQEQRAQTGLDLALEQLSSERLDSQLIGMETLEQITRCESRAIVSKKILSGSCLQKVMAAAQEDLMNATCDMEEEHMNLMKRRAMTVVANALCALGESGDLNDVLRHSADLQSETFICCLVDTLRDAAASPHEATQAARCMQHLMTVKQVETILMEMSVTAIVSDACTHGACCSALLEQESKRLKIQLGSV